MRIAHLTDLHLRWALPGESSITRRRSREMPAVLCEAVERVRGLAADLLVCTGDLLDYPFDRMDDPDTQAQAREDLALVREALSSAPCPYLVVPGNHDHPTLAAEALADVAPDVTLAGLRFLLFRDAEGEGHVPGRLGAERRRFEQALADPASPQVHVQHYLVWPERNEGYPHTYADGEALTEAIVQSGQVRLVLSGHYHAGVRPERIGDTWFATAPALCEAPHPLWVYDLEGMDLQWQAVALRP